MNNHTLMQRIAIVFTVLLWFLPSWIFAQNLIVNGDFEQGNSGFSSKYRYVSPYYNNLPVGIPDTCYTVDNKSTDHGIGWLGWPDVYGYLGSADNPNKYMLVNGWGTTDAPNKYVWKQQVNVTSQTNYTFKCWVCNLSQSYWPITANPSQIRIKINGNWVGPAVTLDINNHDFQQITRTWPSGDVSGQVYIEIYDVYTQDPSDGDDFGLDHISFVPDVLYSVTANDDPDNSVCLNQTVAIPVLDNDVIMPSGNNDNVTLSIITPVNQINGTTTMPTISNNNIIYYNYNDASYTGNTTSFQYKVTWHGLTSIATVQITLNRPPTVGSISDIVPASVCAPYTFSLSSPDINSYGSDLIPSGCGWQIRIGGQWGPIPNPIEYEHNGCSIRYRAENGCGSNNSNTVQLTVNAVPILPNITAPAGICAGLSFDLTTPSVTWRHNDPSTCWGSWEIQIGGVWDSLINNNIPFDYNGCNIRYKARNGCCEEGEYIYSNQVAVTVYSTDPIDEGELTACDAITHHGVQCNQTGTYTSDTIINGCTVPVSWYFNLGEEFIALPEEIQTCDSYYWWRTHKTYETSGNYDTTIVSGNPMICDSTFSLHLTINHAPVFTEQLESPNPIEVCSSLGVLNVSAPSFENGGTPHWEYATSENGPWIDDGFDPTAFNLDYGSYWLRRAVINDCTDEPVTSNPVQFYVSEPPVISIVSGQMPDSICAGDILDLPVVTVDFRNKDQVGGQQWQMADSQEGPYGLYPAMPINDDCWIQYIAQNSCGIDTLGPVHVSVISVDDQYPDPILGCDTVWFDGNYYMRDTVIDRVIGDFCQYTIHNSIVVNHSDRPETNPDLIEEVTWCHDEYFWHGRTYYRSEELQVDRWYTSNIHGCDSIRELRLRFGTANEIWNNNQFGCDSYTWHVNDTTSYTYYYDEDQPHILDTVFIPGVGDDCDTYYYLDLIMGKIWEASESPCDTIPICSGEDYNGVFYSEDIIVYDTLSASTHCDSIVSRYLSIIQPIETTDNIANCVLPYMWYSQDQYHLFVEDGEEYTASLTSLVTGCDSIVTIHFNLLPEITLPTKDTLVCEPFALPDGQIVDQSDLYKYTIHSLDNCDTIVPIQVDFIQTDTLIDDISACNSYTFEGNDYLPGFYPIYYDTVFASNGCISSVHLLNLTVNDSEQMGTISGNANVYVASSLISGIYQYEIDREGLMGVVTWSLSDSNWQIVEEGYDFCRVLVTMPGTAILTAHFNVEECGEMERSFVINATFYGVDDHQDVDVRIFPNPTRNTVAIEAESIEGLRLINTMGQVLEMRECNGVDSVMLNLSGYMPSVYLLEVKTVNGVAKKRLVLYR